MELISFKWKWEEINEWLPIQDAVIGNFLSPSFAWILEIGTWKGGWAISMAENDKSRKILCVDPYPNLDQVKDGFLRTIKERAPEQIVLYPDLDYALSQQGLVLDVIHVDGEHSQEAVLSDLTRSVSYLAPAGLLIIDDIFYHSFPGVTAAAFKVIEQFELSPFLFTEKKLYVCHKDFYDDYYVKAKKLLDLIHLEYEEDQSLSGEDSSYLQRNAIFGHSLLILNSVKPLSKGFYRAINKRRQMDFKEIARELSPPLFFRSIQLLKHKYKGLAK
jgi:hypothetical protein